jgi:hypothetical protein
METLLSRPAIVNHYNLLYAFKESHDFWKNDLFKACKLGSLTQEDFR